MTGAQVLRGRDWADYIARFHTERSGITETQLSRCVDDAGQTPYEWVTAGLPSGVVLDVGCGSAPTQSSAADWVGLDPSRAELAVARYHDRGPLVAATADALPVRDGVADAVLAVMSLMVVDDPHAAATQLGRVLRPGGLLRALLPADHPLTVADRARYGLLLATLGRTALPLPCPAVASNPAGVLEPAGFSITADERRRFRLDLAGRADAEMFVDSLYLPGISRRRVELARALTRAWGHGDIGIPLRRVTAVRPAG